MKTSINKLKYLFLLLAGFFLAGCDDEDGDTNLNVQAIFVQLIDEPTGEVRFVNLSENADTYLWDFGDGSTSTEINPVRTYSSGTYTVSLTASKGDDSDTFTDMFELTVPIAVSLPITFDVADVVYEASTFNGATFEVVANPDQSGTNTSASNVGAITNSGVQFEGIVLELGAPIDLSESNLIAMNVWSTSAIPVLLKLEGTDASIFVETAANHTGSGWELLQFSMASNSSFPKLVLFMDGPGTSMGTFYFDDVQQIDPNVPFVAAPTPTRAEANVISLFSDAYTDTSVDTYRTDWSLGGTLTEISINGDAVLEYAGLNFVGIETVSSQLDISGMTHVHIDIWSPDFTNFDLTIVDFGGNGAFGGGDDTEDTEVVNSPAQRQWVSLDIPLSNFTLGGNTNIAQYVLGGEPAGSFTLYVDNFYFYN